LSPTCHATIEAEANYAASQLLFLQDRFVAEAMSLPVSMDSLKILKQRFGNSNASTLWRMVEQYAGPHPLLGIVSEHPHRLRTRPKRRLNHNGLKSVRVASVQCNQRRF